MSYELKQTTLLEIENETLREQVKALKSKVRELEKELNDITVECEKHAKMVDSVLADLSSVLGIHS